MFCDDGVHSACLDSLTNDDGCNSGNELAIWAALPYPNGFVRSHHRMGAFKGRALLQPLWSAFKGSQACSHNLHKYDSFSMTIPQKVIWSIFWHLINFAAQKRMHQDTVEDGIELMVRAGTLPKSSCSCTTSCYESAEASVFLVRGKHYLHDRKKVTHFIIYYWVSSWWWEVVHLWMNQIVRLRFANLALRILDWGI